MRTVIAGPPGTGKTHTLIHKHLHNELINHKQILKKFVTLPLVMQLQMKQEIEYKKNIQHLILIGFVQCTQWELNY